MCLQEPIQQNRIQGKRSSREAADVEEEEDRVCRWQKLDVVVAGIQQQHPQQQQQPLKVKDAVGMSNGAQNYILDRIM